MAHKTRVGGTNYEIVGGRTRVGGTNYDIKSGRTLIGGTGYDIKLGRRYIFRIFDVNGTAAYLTKQIGVYLDDVAIALETGDTEVDEGTVLKITNGSSGTVSCQVRRYDDYDDMIDSTTVNGSKTFTQEITGNVSVALYTTQATGASYAGVRIYPYLKDIE